MIKSLKSFKLCTAAVSVCLALTGCAGEAETAWQSVPPAAVSGSIVQSTTPVTASTTTLKPPGTNTLIPADPPLLSSPGTTPNTTQGTSSSNTGYYGLKSPLRPGQPADQIWVDAYQCTPNVLTIKAGSIVTWVDYDVHDYTIISDDPGLFAGDLVPSEFGFGFPGNQTFSYCFTTPGTYGWSAPPDYFVSMGVVIVVP